MHNVTEDSQRLSQQANAFVQLDELKVCVSLVNHIYNVFLEAGDGNFEIIMAYPASPGAPALCRGYRISYNGGPAKKAKRTRGTDLRSPAMHAMDRVSNHTKTAKMTLHIESLGFEP